MVCHNKPTSISCVQDTVNIAVKLKSKLLRPSPILPMGDYIAGAHHLKLLTSLFKKGDHVIREKDLNSKDKQNFEAVTHITSNCTLVIKKNPDVLGTTYYLKIIKCINESYLTKKLHPLIRIEKICFAVFF